MRLLHTGTLELTDFIAPLKPPYAILSHTWGEGEILFADVQGGRSALLSCGKPALSKVINVASVARDHGFEYVWIDTCCIDKSSSAELSEAINSMFSWYRKSAVCYAYIADCESDQPENLSAKNRWFTRGWTLQELIAPTRVEFYNRDWVRIGDRAALAGVLSGITRMDDLLFKWHPHECCLIRKGLSTESGISKSTAYLPTCSFCRQNAVGMLESFSVATRMSWAANRTTTREEDLAYSLLGIFGVTMPLLYGEGRNAFLRLQQEIARKTTDQSIFAFRVFKTDEFVHSASDPLGTWLFARSPSWFTDEMYPLTNKTFDPGTPLSLSSAGVELNLHIVPAESHDQTLWIGILNCSSVNDPFV
ncbi:hypothetical protein N0V88_002684 [Collariella sp. IMI 366227]|nr:hypothetical protein N0V88_002684 [Collariella sp. IMI 366227]